MTSRRFELLTLLTVVVVSVAVPLAGQTPQTTVISASRIVLSADETLDGDTARLAVRDGKVIAIGRELTADVLARATRVELPDGSVIVPGFVALHDQLGAAAELAETIDAFTPELRAADGFDPFDRVLPHRAIGGITGIVFAPASTNTFSGISALVKWNGERGVILNADGYLKLALVDASFSRDRYPTSRMGAAELIRSTFADARNPLLSSTPQLSVLRELESGSRLLVIHASTHAELNGAIDLVKELELGPVVLLDAAEIADSIPRLRGTAITVALRPLDWNSRLEALQAPAKLAAAGVPFSFAGVTGAALRRSAALAVKHGLDRRNALLAITGTPAIQSGFGDRIGSLRVGRDADFVVCDGDPTELSSRLLEVWVDGRRVHDARRAKPAVEIAR